MFSQIDYNYLICSEVLYKVLYKLCLTQKGGIVYLPIFLLNQAVLRKISAFFLLGLLICCNAVTAQKYSWLKTFTPSSFNNSQDQFVQVRGNNVIVAGLFQNSINFGSTVLTNQNSITSVFIANYDTTGLLKWAVKGGADNSSERINGLELDEHGNIYIIGSYLNATDWGNLTLNAQSSSTAGFSTESFVVKLDSLGVPLWIEGFYNPTSSLSSNTLQQISIADSSVYILGSLRQNLNVTNTTLNLVQASQPLVDNIFISKFDLNGQLLLLDKIITTVNNTSTTVTDLEAIDDSAYYLSGTFGSGYSFGSNNRTFSNPNSAFAFVISKYTGASCDWLRNSTSTTGFFRGFGVQLEISKTNDLWFAGTYRNNFTFLGQSFQTASFFDFEWFYGKLDDTGALVDIERFVASFSGIASIVENDAYDLLMLGSFQDSISINGSRRFSQGGTDLLLVSVDSSYAIKWFQTGGGANDDFGLGIASQNSSNAYGIATFQGLSQFGSAFLSTPISQNASLLFKIGDCASNQTPINFIGDTLLCSGQSVRIIAAPNSPSVFQWLRDSMPLTGEIFRDLTVSNTGNYQVIVNGSGCSDTSRVIPVVVNTIPAVSLSVVDTVCLSASPFVLSGGTPAGGVYTGRGVVSDSIFDPSIAGIGNTAIKYVFSNGGCADSTTANVYVQPAQSVFFAPLADICINASPITLLAFPFGGTFSGVGVNGNQFDPGSTNGGAIPITYTYLDPNGCVSNATQLIQVDTFEISTFSALPDLCANSGIYHLTEGSPAGGVYSGTAVSNSTFDPSLAGPGTFTLSYITLNPCGNDTSTQTITVNPTPTVGLPAFSDLCADSLPVALNSGTPVGGTYSGPGVVNATFDPAITGVGTFTIFYNFTDGFGCAATDSSTLRVNALPTVSISNDTSICAGDSVTLSAGGGATYLWSNMATADSIAVSPGVTSTYVVTVTSASGCRAIDSVGVRVNPLPIASITGNATICEGFSTTLTATGGTRYAWSTNAVVDSITVSPLSDSSYTVTVTDGNGCSATASQLVTVNPTPTVGLPAFSDLCADAPPVALNSGTPVGGTYSGPGVVNATFDPAITGVGTFTIFYNFTDGFGCAATDSSTLRVNALPTVSISNDTSICAGDSVTLSAGGGATYLWSNMATADSIAVSPGVTSTYVVTVTSASGCRAIDSVGVRVNPLPIASITGNATICEGFSTTLTATGGTRYAWNTNAVVDSITVSPLSDSSYTVTVTDGNGCSATASQLVTVNPTPTVGLPAFSDVCADAPPVALNSGTPVGGTYSGPGVVNATFDPAITGVGTFTIFYNFTDGFGCAATDSSTLRVNALPTVSISNDTSICAGDSVTLSAGGGATYLWSNMATADSIAVSPGVTSTYVVTVTSASGCRAIDSVGVRVNPLPIASITGNATICEGFSTTLTATGGTRYAWSTNALVDSITVSPLSDSSYTVTVTDGNGCSATASQLVTVNPTPTVGLPAFSDLCADAPPVALNSGTPVGGTYSGPGVVNATFDPAITGVGTFTIFYNFTDGFGCAATDSSTLRVNALPTVSISNDTSICAGDSVTLSAGGGATYLWSNMATADSIAVSPGVTSTYVVTVTSASGCRAIDSVGVRVNPLPIASITGNATICEGFSTTLTATGGTRYAWSTNALVDSITVSPLSDSSYTVTVTDGNGCSATASQLVTVNPTPTVGLPAFSDLCADAPPVALNSGTPVGGTYSGPGVVNATFDPAITGVGTFTIFYNFTDGFGCAATDSSTLRVNALPTVSISNDTSICAGDSVTLSAGGGATYLWSNMATADSIAVSPGVTSTYVVTVTSASGCRAIDSVDVRVKAQPILSTSDNTAICVGDFTVINSSSTASNYLWNTGDTTASILVNPFQSTDYIVVSTNSNGCSISDTVRVTVLFGPPIFIGNDTTLNDGSMQSVTYDAGRGFIGYIWQDNSTNQTITITYDPAKAGTIDTIVVLAISAVECNSIDTAFVRYDFPTSLDHVYPSGDKVKVYPNPTEGDVSLAFTSPIQVNKVRIYDAGSRLIREQVVNRKLDNINLNLSQISRGVYFIQITTASGQVTRKIIVN
jgi:hypothetical protein